MYDLINICVSEIENSYFWAILTTLESTVCYRVILLFSRVYSITLVQNVLPHSFGGSKLDCQTLFKMFLYTGNLAFKIFP